jgi:hypothetical protein
MSINTWALQLTCFPGVQKTFLGLIRVRLLHFGGWGTFLGCKAWDSPMSNLSFPFLAVGELKIYPIPISEPEYIGSDEGQHS